MSRDKDVAVFIPADNLAAGVIGHFMTNTKILIIGLFLTLFCNCSEKENHFLKSGLYDYGRLNIAYDNKTNRLSGYYRSQEKEWDCDFFIEGKLEKDTFRIVIKDKRNVLPIEPIKGKLYCKEDSILEMKIEQSISADCWRVLKGAEHEGVNFYLSKETNWTKVLVVNKKTYFHSEPNDNARKNSYLIEGDIFCVKSENENWLYGEYHAKNGITEGWIRRTDVFPLLDENELTKLLTTRKNAL